MHIVYRYKHQNQDIMRLIFCEHYVYKQYIYSAKQMDKTYLNENVLIRVEMKFLMRKWVPTNKPTGIYAKDITDKYNEDSLFTSRSDDSNRHTMSSRRCSTKTSQV